MFVHSFEMMDSIKIHYTIAGIKKKINKIKKNLFVSY